MWHTSKTIPNGNDRGFPWFALRVRSRIEKAIAAHLDRAGYEWFLPTYFCRRRWSDRLKEVELPLFPGYLFCRFDPQRRLPILMMPGVMYVVGAGKNPVAVQDAEILALEKVVRSGLPTQPWPFARVGQPVRIEYGPLSGLEGTLSTVKGRHRIVVSVTILQRSVGVEIDEGWVNPVTPAASRYMPVMAEHPWLSPVGA